MESTKYDVYMDDNVIAEYMTLTTALLLIEAYYNHYYNDNNFTMTIRPCEKCKAVGEDSAKNV